MNKIILIGNLTKDPESGATPSGVSYCRFSIAVNRRFSRRGGLLQRGHLERRCGKLCEVAQQGQKGRRSRLAADPQLRDPGRREAHLGRSHRRRSGIPFLSERQQRGRSPTGQILPRGRDQTRRGRCVRRQFTILIIRRYKNERRESCQETG